jgi:hypothetical protein
MAGRCPGDGKSDGLQAGLDRYAIHGSVISLTATPVTIAMCAVRLKGWWRVMSYGAHHRDARI